MILYCLGVLLAFLIYYKLARPLNYWKKRGVAQEKAWPLVGSLGDLVLRRRHIMDIFIDMYRNHPDERYVGYYDFTGPNLLLRDLDVIKQVAVKDFDHFPDHQGLVQVDSDPIVSRGLITLRGEEWRKMRATLSPAFTGSKMRAMYLLMEECAEDFVKHFHGKEAVAVEMKEVFSRFSTDVIATAAFGIKIDSLNEPKNEFFVMTQWFTEPGAWRIFKAFVAQISPKLARFVRLRIFPAEVTAFFRSVVTDTIARREAEGIVRPDLIHLLMEARKGKLDHDALKGDNQTGFATAEESHIGKDRNLKMVLTEDDIVAQAVLFFFGGFDTVSTASSFLAYELAVNPDVQARLQEEIDAVSAKHQGRAPYDALLGMKYFDQVICESLRMWPPAFQTERLCEKDFVFQPQKPGEKEMTIEKGTSVVIPIIAIQRDPDYYPEPGRFDPERFSDENKSKVVPGSYMPFGIGPRNCIGSRFALLEVKTLFFHLLSKFDVVVVEKTPIPMRFSPKQLKMAPDEGFWLGMRPRKVTSL